MTNYAAILAALLTLSIQGCASLQYAGVASYSVKPFMAGDKAVCCEVTINNGKEIARLDARVEKRGDDYTVHLKQWNIEAFEGQKIAAEAATTAVETAATAASAILIAPAAASVGAAAIGAIAK